MQSNQDNNKYKVIFVLGPPGSGKNTQCDLIVNNFNLKHFSCGDLLRAEARNPDSKLGDLINQIIKEGKIVPGEITCSLAKKAMDSVGGTSNTYIIDGFPRNKENLESWQKTFNGQCDIAAVIWLECSEEVCTKRIKKRSQNSGRIDDNDDSLRRRFQTFQVETSESLEELSKLTKILKIKADSQGIEEVFEQVKVSLNSLGLK